MRDLKSEGGAINVLLLPLVIVSVLFLSSTGFGFWAYSQMTDYRDNVDSKIQTAVKVAVDKNSSQKDTEFIEKEKQPTRTFKGSEILGSITFDYPKTWSGYLTQTDRDLKLIMQPGIVDSGDSTVYPLRVEVVDQKYDQVLKTFENNVKNGKTKASAFRSPKLPSVLGTRFDGEIKNGTQGSMVVMPIREKTVKISAEADIYLEDFNKIILPSFVFTP